MPSAPPSVAVLLPAQDAMPTRAVEALLGVLMSLGPGSGVFFADGPSPTVAKRNQLVHRFLNESAAAWAFFLDTDMVPDPDVLPRLLARNKDIVGALYFARFGPPHPYAGWHRPDGLEDPVTPEQGLTAVDWVASGALLVRRSVFQRLREPWFLLSGEGLGSGRNEDMGFCAKARAGGLGVWCDTDVIVGHLGAPQQVGLAEYRAAFPGASP